MEKELEYIGNGVWRWNFIEGKRYDLGSHHGNFFGLNGEDVTGTFIGRINGYNVFVDIRDKILHCYSGTSDDAYWYSDDEEGPSFAIAKVNYDGEARDEKLKKFILEKLENKLIPKE